MTRDRTSELLLVMACVAAGLVAAELTRRFLMVSAFRVELARL